ncbi:hypothetical protein ABIE85_001460 [Bradyrhizobium diazoefficiens]|uniref:hypothetical protein n=1 Tax=Bradyrhizobium diazoefficiens TaxID=1355477 RepID=UPI00272D700B|nr:hypothetical protein [Bradyrhizobium diazoefficiens]WLA60274.1 hypothetical protein QIH81_16895 [Bradyrhizobium diazoefficiens]
MESVEQLRKISADAQMKLHRLEVAQREAANGAKVGKTFKYRNSYSCPEKPSDYWWMYSKVTHMKDGLLYATTFQTDKYGNVHVKTNEGCYHMQGHTPIPAGEFNRAWKALRKKLDAAL